MRGLYESFFGSSQDDDESDDEYDFSTDRSVQMYTWGDHRVQTETDTDSLRADADRLAGVDDARADLLREAADEYEQMQREPVKFECPTCHLGHSHSASKHALTGDLDVRRAFVAGMKYEDNCHCGVNELAMLVDFFHYINVPVFTDQDRFEAVLELAHDDVRAIINATNEVTVEEAREAGMDIDGRDEAYLTLDNAVEWVRREQGVATLVPDDIMPELRKFHRRVKQVKSAANSAPIPQTARTDIEEARQGIRSAISDTSDVPDEPR